MTLDLDSLAESVLAGDRLFLARLLTLIENDDPKGLQALSLLYSHTGKAHLVGITGAPGTGKSTLVNRLAAHFRKDFTIHNTSDTDHPPTVAIVAVDPSSPFTGGAILGDRIRMRDLAGDPGVFIRSMASRGALGGLAKATSSVVETLDAAGFDTILIETVGAGQAEVEIARTAHTTVVISAPGLGDDVQAIKAGILEIADILVVNKSDIPGADNTLRVLQSAIMMGYPEERLLRIEDDAREVSQSWIPPILSTVATTGEGIPDLAEAIREHHQFLTISGKKHQREREYMRSRMVQLLGETLVTRFFEEGLNDHFEKILDKVIARELEPRQAVQLLIEQKLS
jgi:LAO/AO transport system kinase